MEINVERGESVELHVGVVDHFVHPLHVPPHVHLLLGLVRTVGTVELRFFAALPLLMVPQRAPQLVKPAALRTSESLVAVEILRPSQYGHQRFLFQFLGNYGNRRFDFRNGFRGAVLAWNNVPC